MTKFRVALCGLAGLFAMTMASTISHAADPVRGGTLTIAIGEEPPLLNSALNTVSSVYAISPKLFDGLVTYDRDFTLRPQLATSWDVSADGKTITFKLRPDVKWHDGAPFTSADVQYTFMNVLKTLHPRGKVTFVNLTAVDTPDPLTAIFRMSAPSPYVLRALASAESPVLPKHIYEGTEPVKNPANVQPIGTGPFKLKEWARGNYVLLERNPDYWDRPKPYLDAIIYRVIPDASARAVALETNAAQYGSLNSVPQNDVARLAKLPNLTVTTDGYEYNTSVSYLEFNLQRPALQDPRVRRAIAHAVNRTQLANNVWFGFASPATSPITDKQADFHSAAGPVYNYDLKAAAALLDEAGLKPGAGGIRLSLTLDYSPNGTTYRQVAEVIKASLSRVGIAVEMRQQDNPTYLRRVWDQYDFDMNVFAASNIADPVIGIQRFYWSQTIQKGVSYSNGSHYNNPEMDRILEAAQAEPDSAKRRALYGEMQKLVMTDLPNLPLVYIQWFTIHSKQVQNLNLTGLGPFDGFADVYLQK